MRMMKNTTDIPSRFVKRMMSWVAYQVELSPRDIWGISISKTKFLYSGTAYRNKVIILRIGPESTYPTRSYYHNGIPHWFCNRIQGLVFVAAHEAVHIWQFKQEQARYERTMMDRRIRRDADRERQSDSVARLVLSDFMKNEDKLVTEWSAESIQKAACRSED